jgi:hypothetical protein
VLKGGFSMRKKTIHCDNAIETLKLIFAIDENQNEQFQHVKPLLEKCNDQNNNILNKE